MRFIAKQAERFGNFIWANLAAQCSLAGQGAWAILIASLAFLPILATIGGLGLALFGAFTLCKVKAIIGTCVLATSFGAREMLRKETWELNFQAK